MLFVVLVFQLGFGQPLEMSSDDNDDIEPSSNDASLRASAEQDEKIIEAAKANNLANFSSYLERMLDELFIDRMDGNEEIFSRVMTDKQFRAVAHEHLASEIFRRVRESA